MFCGFVGISLLLMLGVVGACALLATAAQWWGARKRRRIRPSTF